MHKDKLVVAIKVGGKVLREIDGTVMLPFGCEYSILVKNLDSVRIQMSVNVDGQEATQGTRLIVNPNSHMELERFIRNGNLNEGNRFKFIERTEEVEAHRGVNIDDSLIRVESWRERIIQHTSWNTPLVRRPLPPRPDSVRGLRPGQPMMAGPRSQVTASSSMQSRTGITAPGSKSDQRFMSTYGFALEPQSTVIVIKLAGEMDGVQVDTPITTTDHNPVCSSCGKTSKATYEFCPRCGTALFIL